MTSIKLAVSHHRYYAMSKASSLLEKYNDNDFDFLLNESLSDYAYLLHTLIDNGYLNINHLGNRLKDLISH
jgi:hypothetical protein